MGYSGRLAIDPIHLMNSTVLRRRDVDAARPIVHLRPAATGELGIPSWSLRPHCASIDKGKIQ